MEPQEEPQYAPSDVIAVLDRLTEMIEEGRSVPFSASVMINQAEGVELLDNARSALPADLVNADRIVADSRQPKFCMRRERVPISWFLKRTFTARRSRQRSRPLTVSARKLKILWISLTSTLTRRCPNWRNYWGQSRSKPITAAPSFLAWSAPSSNN